VRNPGAADTAQGILQWWLRQTWAEQGTGDVQRAIELLVKKGWLTETAIPSPKIYRIDEERLGEINEYLSTLSKK